MIELLLTLSILSKSVIGFEHPNHPGDFYTSGVGEKRQTYEYYLKSGFALLIMPSKFSCNAYDPPLPAGHYLLEPLSSGEVPSEINFRRNGKVVGTATIVDYKELSYQKSSPSANIEIINNGRMAQINLIYDRYELYALVNLHSRLP
jgi:hypothetical protein